MFAVIANCVAIMVTRPQTDLTTQAGSGPNRTAKDSTRIFYTRVKVYAMIAIKFKFKCYSYSTFTVSSNTFNPPSVLWEHRLCFRICTIDALRVL